MTLVERLGAGERLVLDGGTGPELSAAASTCCSRSARD